MPFSILSNLFVTNTHDILNWLLVLVITLAVMEYDHNRPVVPLHRHRKFFHNDDFQSFSEPPLELSRWNEPFV